ncbi:MAG TPA: lysylphosphatidylglycerol synthase transmembrane domain-containing protein [Salinivirgaceae bacterium]|nr:lysylphosphatidylglycerol synthase transmembrane domain-containing protein [Salinivirgaceae bacterium]HQA75500.1 lysylphosphatidylglycerol synthase transmembrane domain-containing protein [Salinivirgaceae bacterium]
MIKILKLGITLFIFVFLIWKFDLNFVAVYSQIKYSKYIFIGLLTPLLIHYISANRWKIFLKQIGIKESIWSLTKINYTSIFQGLILPSSQGYDIIRIYQIEKKHPENRGSASSTIIIERIIGFIVLCALSLIFSIFNRDLSNQKQVILIIGSISFTLFILITLLLNKRLHAIIANKSFNNNYLQKFFSYFDKMYRAIAYFPYRKILFSSVILILLFQLSTIICVYLIFKAYGFDIPLYQHISLYPIISILSMIPITISGFGIREGFFVYFYSQIGVPADVSIGVSIINYMIIVLLPAMIGGILYLLSILKKEKTI